MAIRKSITTVLALVFLLGFIFVGLPQTGHAQGEESACCQYGLTSGEVSCVNTNFICPKVPPPTSFDGVFIDSTCNKATGLCSGVEPLASEVPTLSEWGMIAMAGVLGLVGFMVARRRKATA